LLYKYLGELKKKKKVILCGDLNYAHKGIDIARPKSNIKSTGFTIEERISFKSEI
jgi:exodeoxyribonuclease-3